jgi:hypothetical protein
MKRHLVLISVGVLNFLHGMFHVIQFIQSMLLVAYSTEHAHGHEHESWIESIMHSPVFAAIWAIIGILTLVIGIKDYRHHKKCNHDKNHTHE